MKEGEKQSELLFIQMINSAKDKDEIDNGVDTLALCLLLQSLYSAIYKYMISRFDNPDYEYNQEEINSLVDSLLYIVLNGIRKSKAKTCSGFADEITRPA